MITNNLKLDFVILYDANNIIIITNDKNINDKIRLY